jgi:hypothetical protein
LNVSSSDTMSATSWAMTYCTSRIALANEF